MQCRNSSSFPVERAEKMVEKLPCLFLFFLFIFLSFSQSRCLVDETRPRPIESSFNIKPRTTTTSNQVAARKCSYTVIIKTSCSSPPHTRDKVSLAFGDAYGNEVYAKRLDDPRSRTFERCSSDTFNIRGPCTYGVCYLYLRRVGSDGWKPESVKVFGPDRRGVTFNYNIFLPNGVWFGFKHCNAAQSNISS